MSEQNFDPTNIFAALNRGGVKYLVIGGIAVVLYGVARVTWDVDLVVELTTPNLKQLSVALRRIGFVPRVPAPPEGLADPKTRRLWIQRKNMKDYSFVELKSPQRIIDVMINPPPNFTQLYRHRTTVKVRGMPVPLMPVKALARMKRAAGRFQDLLDLEDLKRLRLI